LSMQRRRVRGALSAMTISELVIDHCSVAPHTLAPRRRGGSRKRKRGHQVSSNGSGGTITIAPQLVNRRGPWNHHCGSPYHRVCRHLAKAAPLVPTGLRIRSKVG
jgi:hypothetical protein